MPWTKIEIDGKKEQIHFRPTKEFLKGKISIEEVQKEIQEAIKRLKEQEELDRRSDS